MADTLTMAGTAFGRPFGRSRSILHSAAGLLHTGGSGGRRTSHRKRRHRRGFKSTVHHRRGVVLSNEFLKTVVLMELMKGAMRQ